MSDRRLRRKWNELLFAMALRRGHADQPKRMQSLAASRNTEAVGTFCDIVDKVVTAHRTLQNSVREMFANISENKGGVRFGHLLVSTYTIRSVLDSAEVPGGGKGGSKGSKGAVLSRAQIRQARQIFYSFDHSGDGRIGLSCENNVCVYIYMVSSR